MPCPKGKKLEASHGKLEDLVSRYIPSWLPDGTAELLDDVVSEVLECIQCCDCLVVVEGFRRSLAEEKDYLEHVHSGLVDSCLKKSRFPLRVTCIFSVIVIVIFRSICQSQRPYHAKRVGFVPGLQTECKASVFPAGSEGASSLLPL